MTAPSAIDIRRPPLPHWTAAAPACRWCGRTNGTAPAPPHGEYGVGGWWHDDCLTAYAIAVSSKAQRHFVEQRDHGVCARCGANADRHRLWQNWRDRDAVTTLGWTVRHHGKGHRDRDLRCLAPVTWISRRHIPFPNLPPIIDWQADHITPLWQVDRSLPWADLIRFWSLDNLQTLCSACHKAKSSAETTTRATLRRPPNPQLPLFATLTPQLSAQPR